MKGDKKDHTLHLRLSKAERQTIDRLATESGRKLSAIVRDLLQESLINHTAANERGVIR